MFCRSCGTELAPGARFCSNCGASQTRVEEERRIVTALFADIVGFTALAERRDPEEVKHVVDRTFAELSGDITTFGGVVDKIVGDQIVALFGAPIAHSDDAERAVRAGLRMQSTVRELDTDLGLTVTIRVGINTGEVLVGSTTAGGDYTAMGDVMNSASRLQEMAQSGQVVVGDSTRRATGDAIRYESLGSLPTRGRDDPLDAWLAVESTRPPGARRRKAELFVGRERELAFLEAQAMMAIDLRAAQLSVVLGEAGMGKSRLIEETSNRLADQVDLVVVEGQCVAYGEANVWWPIGEVLRDLFHIDPDSSRGVTESRLLAALSDRFGQGNPEVARWSTALLHVLGHETPLRRGDRNRNRAEVALAVTSVLEHELRQHALVLVLTDMHWAAEAVWTLLEHVLNELARTRLFVMVSAQNLDSAHVFGNRHGTSVVRLGPLGQHAALRLLDELGTSLPAASATEMVSRSGGNPYFLEELAELVLDGGGGRAGNGSPSSGEARPNLDQLPVTLRGIVAARLDSLQPGERALIEDASVLGRTGSVVGLATLAKEGRGVDDITDSLAGLVAQDLLAVNGPRYEFQSDLLRDVAYGTLTKTVRAHRHLGIANYLASTQSGPIRNSVVVAIADHYRAAAQLVNEVAYIPGLDRAEVVTQAVHWLAEAGNRALEIGEPAEAERWFDHGVALATDDDSLVRFLYGRAKARSEIHEIAGARADLDRLDPLLSQDPIMAAKSLVIRGDVDRKAGDLDRAAGELREAADRLAVLEVPDEQALALRLLGMTEIDRGDDSLARQALTSSRTVAARAGDRRSEAWALQSLAWHAFVRGQVRAAENLVGQAMDIFAELGDRTGLSWTRGLQAWVAFHLGEWDTARELVSTVLPEARRRGDPWAEAIILNLAASLALWSGRAGEAKNLARESQSVAERAEDHGVAVQSMALEGRALVSLGRIAEGTALLEQAFVTADRLDDRDARRIAIISNCSSAARVGEPERAIRWAARFDGVHDDPTNLGETDLAVSLALAMLQRGAVAEAASQLSWGDARDGDRPGRYEDAVAAVVAVIQDQPEAADRSVQAVLTGNSTYLDRVLALSARAAGRFRQGDDAGCDEALASAWAELDSTDDQTSRFLLDLLSALCDRGDLSSAEQQLRASGLDPTGWRTVWSLASDRRVAGL